MGGGIQQNFNLFWTAGTGLAIYFLFVHAPQYLSSFGGVSNISPTLWIHLVGVYPIYLACIHNTLITPTTFKKWAKPLHIWIGRIGLTMGVVGFVTGVILEWTTLDRENLGGAIGVTIGGTIQMTAQFFGYRAIKRHQDFKKKISKLQQEAQVEQKNTIADDENGCPNDDVNNNNNNKDEIEIIDELKIKRDSALISHVYNMLGVFLLGCGIPSLNRLPLPEERSWIYYVLIVFFVVVMIVWGRLIEKRILTNSDRRRNHQSTDVNNKTTADETITTDEEVQNGEDTIP